MQFSLDTVRAVTRLLHESDLAEISLETTDSDATPSRLTVRRQAPRRGQRRPAAPEYSSNGSSAETGAGATNDADTVVSTAGDTGADGTESSNIITVSATAVGVFRVAQPALKVADSVKLGQVVGIVESLKIPNEVIAPVAGEIIEVLATEGQAVEYGQSLLLINASQ